ncbi:NADPH-dependent assimilatory sulfite reductase hemoprotein subunit [Methylacidimicrobium sp. B4]|uniref:NADPH-dependent assimilatory sulfite reductase hemoprotein subunit n=1 Tax=Methylacidimicrobium sp. B4 TaxID=2796139 RepID=UPI001A90C49D|nr:NADPH-dependent assimilatory sulfite reductase hemoprotein subunit [Methylacidimicrobium sp. B4]QSR85415.1 NADPH-dependent assimilatory sulfite reductase hemoprotein subunit [Methylacidimicrobium sp. B4]
MSSSPVEQIKEESRQLRGTLAAGLRDATSPHFSDTDAQILKFHGSYQQDDRDRRAERRKAGLDKDWIFMIRTKTPGGRLSAAQYLALDRLAETVGNGTLRITTRQGIQLHGVRKLDLRRAVAEIISSGILTWGACGDVVRNTLATPVPAAGSIHRELQELAAELSQIFLSRSRAYSEVWIDGEPLPLGDGGPAEDEPIYGATYLPRKFKIAIALPPRNDVDVFSNDLGLVAHASGQEVEGYTLLVGGGHGMTHGLRQTQPHLAEALFYVPKERVREAAVAVVTAQRDYGNREDRKRSRLKYLLLDRGIDWLRQEVASRLSFAPEPPRPFSFTTVADPLGWHEQGDGKLFLGLFVQNGRILDREEGPRLRQALRQAAIDLGLPIRLTANGNLFLADVGRERKAQLEELFAKHGVSTAPPRTATRAICHACVALPTCGLALAESERVFPSMMEQIDRSLEELGLREEPILIRMSGCPNGCSRPYNADLSFVGRSPGKYAFYAGGSVAGDRLAGLERRSVGFEEIPELVRSYLAAFARDRLPEESFSQYWARTRPRGPLPSPDQFHEEAAAAKPGTPA